MSEHPDPRLTQRLRLFSMAASAFSAAVGISGLIGSALNIRSLVTWGVEPVTMKVNTAACFLLAGISLWLLRKENGQILYWQKAIGRTAALLVGAIGLISDLEFLFGWNLGVDRLLLSGLHDSIVLPSHPRLMSPITGFIFLVSGMALLVLNWRTKNKDWPAQYFCAAGAIAGGFGFMGVLFESAASNITLAVPTVVAFVALTGGIISARPDWALAGLLTSQTQGSRWMRQSALATVTCLAFFVWILSKPLLTTEHFTLFQTSAIVILIGTLLAIFIGWTALLLNRSDGERERDEQALRWEPGNPRPVTGRYDDSPIEGSIRLWSTSGIALGVILAGIAGLLSWNSVRQAAEDADWVAHTQAVSATIEATLADITDVESGARSFAATGDAAFLQTFPARKLAITHDIKTLERLTADDLVQQQRVYQLASQVASRTEFAEQTIAERRRTGSIPPAAIFREGKKRMDAVSASLDEMRSEETRLLDQHTQRSNTTRRRNRTVTLFTTMAGIVLLVIAGLVTSQEIGHSARMRGEIQSMNADLERRVAERATALEKSQQLLQGIFNSALDSIIALDERRRVVFFNEAAQRTFRCSAAQAIGRPIEDFIPERFRAAHPDRVRRFAESGVTNRSVPGVGELWALRADGEEFQFEASLSQTGTPGNKTFTVILRDVTGQKIAEKAQRALASIVTLSHDAIIGKNLDGIVTNWNPGAEEIYGYTAAEMIGRSIHTLIPRDRADDFASIMRAIKNGENLRHYESVRVKKDGQPIHVSLSISPVRDDSGNIVGASTIARDITERKQAEELLRESEEKYRTLFDSMVEGFSVIEMIFDENEKPVDFTFLEISPSFEAQTGIKNALGKTMRELAPGTEQRWFDFYGNVALTGEPGHVENEAREQSRWYDVYASRIGEPGQRRVAVIFADITARKQAETALRNLNNALEQRVHERTAELESANKELEAFTYSVSHDLRAPLRHISGFSKILVEEFGSSLPAEAHHHLDRIQQGTRRMGQLVDDLLNLARVGRRDVALHATGLNSLVEEVITNLKLDVGNREVEWRVGVLPFIDCDAALMKQVFENLLANALKFTRPRPRALIEVGQEEKDGHTVVYIRDNGVGFSMKYADKLFGVFQRLHRPEDFEGTGVGLATVQRIIQKHGGQIWAEAELDKGATFYFTMSHNETNEVKSQAVVVGEKT